MKKILFCGGGSAGHVIPNVAIIECLNGITENYYIGTDGIESKICAENNIKFYKCGAVKVVRGKILCNLALPFKLLKCIGEAGDILDKIKPDLVFCKGGYACVPPAIAARKRKIPVITHESDVSAGLANKFIANRCNKVLTTFPSTARKFRFGICTGSPMRQKLFGRNKAQARAHYGLDMRPTILVIGGGSGSKIINENLRKCAAKICKSYNILHLCGKSNVLDTNIYGYKQLEFENDMGLAYACADFAVSRCGSNAANELIALKIPTLFIPLQNKRTRGDQVKNAELFRDAGLCRVLYENELTPLTLEQNIAALMNDINLKTALAKSTVQCGNDKIVKEIMNTLNDK